jgi:hypothetical protein
VRFGNLPGPTRGLALALALFLTWQGLTLERASAQTPGPAAKPAVVLDNSACLAVPQAELRKLVALELSPRRLVAPGELDPDTPSTTARVVCSANQARLSVQDAAQGKQQELELDLEETMPAAHARLLALTLCELIATLDMEVAGSGPEPAAAARDKRTTLDPWRGHWWLGAGIAREGSPALLAPALHSGMVWFLPRLPLALQLDLLGSHGRRTLAEGKLSSWTFSASPALTARLRSTWVDVLLGAGLRLGYARLEGSSQAAAEVAALAPVSGFWWGPLLSGSLLIRLHQRWGLRTALELAYVAKPVRGLDSQGEPAYALEHLQLHALLALSVAFR